MIKSVRWRLIFNNLFVSLGAVLAVGLATLFLVDTYFAGEEREFLESEAEMIAPMIASMLPSSTEAEVQQFITFTSFFRDVKIDIYDINEKLAVSSGDGQTLSLVMRDQYGRHQQVDMVLDSKAQVIRVGPADSAEIQPNSNVFQTFELDRLITRQDEDTLQGVSDQIVRVPLTISNQTIGYLDLSQGPAVGQNIIRSVQVALLIGCILAFLGALFAGSLSAQRVTRPLLSLGDAAERMHANDLTARAPQTGLIEYDRLAGQFNQMANRLTHTIESLEDERAVLRRMIGDASHELRTPLTALNTFNQLLREEVTEPAAAVAFLAQCQAQIEQLDRITVGLLDLSRLEARLAGTNFEDGDLRATLDRAVQSIVPVVSQKQQTIIATLPEKPVFYSHDASAFERAISNLLSNASKYSPEQKPILLKLYGDGHVLIVDVIDCGDGISAENIPYLFDRFYRIPGQQENGSGLGLAITSEIVRIHDGTIECISDVGEGSTFRIRLPLKPRQISANGAEPSSPI